MHLPCYLQEREREQRRHSSSRSRSRSWVRSASPARQAAAAGSAEKRSRKPKRSREEKRARSRSKDCSVSREGRAGKDDAREAVEEQEQEREGVKRQRSSSPVADREGAERVGDDRCSQGLAAWLGVPCGRVSMLAVFLDAGKLSSPSLLKCTVVAVLTVALAVVKLGLHACCVVLHACDIGRGQHRTGHMLAPSPLLSHR